MMGGSRGSHRTKVSFFSELKRRNVVRVGIAYAVIGWVLAQIAEFAFENFGAPDWVLKTFVVLLLLGLPIALVFAWAFEVTPEGIKREKDVDRNESVTSQTGRKLDFLIIGVLVFAVAILVLDRFSGDRSASETAGNIQSIAVLPFANMSDDSDHFADGLTEELLNHLAKNDDLKVAGRTSSFAFKGQNDDLRQIGNALGVSKVLEGSVRRDGDRVRVTAQLINVDDGFHIWSDTYDTNLASIFEIQDQVAGAITRALELHLTPAAKRLTDNPEAYAFYLEAVAFANFENDDDVVRGIEALDRATKLDPQFAKAFELKAIFHWQNAGWFAPAEEERARVIEAANRALAIDPTLPAAIAMLETSADDATWIDAIVPFERLVKVDRRVLVLDAYAWNLLTAGYFSEAEEIFREVLARDPLSPHAWRRLADTLYAQGRITEAQHAARKSAEFSPGYFSPGLYIQWRYALTVGDDEEAIRIMTPWFDAEFQEWFRKPSAEAFVSAARDPDTGRAALKEWVEYRVANQVIPDEVFVVEATFLHFGHLDLFSDAIDVHVARGDVWSGSESQESTGVIMGNTGYRASKHYIERAKAKRLTDLWDHRGAPDHCSKESGEWVCQ